MPPDSSTLIGTAENFVTSLANVQNRECDTFLVETGFYVISEYTLWTIQTQWTNDKRRRIRDSTCIQLSESLGVRAAPDDITFLHPPNRNSTKTNSAEYSYMLGHLHNVVSFSKHFDLFDFIVPMLRR